MYAHRTDPYPTAQRARRRLVAALAAVAVAVVAYTSAAVAAPNRQPDTPSQCILRNHGDWNACNVGNSGSGDLPYRPVH